MTRQPAIVAFSNAMVAGCNPAAVAFGRAAVSSFQYRNKTIELVKSGREGGSKSEPARRRGFAAMAWHLLLVRFIAARRAEASAKAGGGGSSQLRTYLTICSLLFL
jgi:hypothetical protein